MIRWLQPMPDGSADPRRSASGNTRNDEVATVPLRARQEERPRVVTVTQRVTTKIPTGRRISRWQEGSATDFPS